MFVWKLNLTSFEEKSHIYPGLERHLSIALASNCQILIFCQPDEINLLYL